MTEDHDQRQPTTEEKRRLHIDLRQRQKAQEQKKQSLRTKNVFHQKFQISLVKKYTHSVGVITFLHAPKIGICSIYPTTCANWETNRSILWQERHRSGYGAPLWTYGRSGTQAMAAKNVRRLGQPKHSSQGWDWHSNILPKWNSPHLPMAGQENFCQSPQCQPPKFQKDMSPMAGHLRPPKNFKNTRDGDGLKCQQANKILECPQPHWRSSPGLGDHSEWVQPPTGAF